MKVDTIFIDDEFQDIIDQLQEAKTTGDFEKVKVLSKELEDKAVLSGNTYSEALAQYFHAICGFYYNTPSITKEHCLKAKEICKDFDYHKLYALICMTEGSAYVYLNERQSAIGSFLEGYYLATEYSLGTIRAQTLNNIGSIFADLESYDISLDYYIKSFKIMEELESCPRRAILILHLNIVYNYVRKGDFKKAIEWEETYLAEEHNSSSLFVRNSLLACHILMEYKDDTPEELEAKINEYLDYVQTSNIDNHFMQIIFDVIECCYDINNVHLAKKIIDIIEPVVAGLDVYDYKERLLYVKTELWQILGDKKALYSDLLEYRDIVNKAKIVKQENECVGLLSQIQLQEIEEKRKQMEIRNQELKRQNELDMFTGLLNKVAFRKRLEERLVRKSENIGRDVLILVDIDNFKRINDVYGHITGDIIIKEMANLLKSKARDIDYVGRIGGDEFCILLIEVYSIESVKNLLESLVKEIHDLRVKDLEDVNITVSVGAALLEKEKGYTYTFEKVDKAMYLAKKKGKNTYEISI